VTCGRGAILVFDGIRKLAPKMKYVSVQQVLKIAAVDMNTAPSGRGR
jgi:hypothetical protein